MDRTDIALNRFGLGARPGDRAKIGDPARWLKGQLTGWRPEIAGQQQLTTRGEIIGAINDLQGAVARGKAVDPKRSEDKAVKDTKTDLMAFSRIASRSYRDQVGLRLQSAVETDAPFVERLVHFWANHFAVSTEKQGVNALAGLFEFEAIRPHVLGSFEQMLIAVEQHPAMLLYLDQVQSVGPNSIVAQRSAANGRKRGLNENLAREIMELHTLGVRSGYTQADVTQFAGAITGWYIAGYGGGFADEDVTEATGRFRFAQNMHEPGTRKIMGKDYPHPGLAQGIAVLKDLAANPATAKHLATKLARHFAGDDPPPALVNRLEQAWAKSGGDLPTVYAALIDAPESWVTKPVKFRTPWEWVVASFRATGISPVAANEANQDRLERNFATMLTNLGQTVWRPGSPAGFDDIAASWAGPDALVRRVEVAQQLARRTPPATDPRAAARSLFGESLSKNTADVIAGAEGPQQGVSLLMVSPEMMRR
jgi:uncharacterized protein (DUF1800 family)